MITSLVTSSKLPLLSGLQAKGQGVSFAKKVFQAHLSPLLGLGVGQHRVAGHGHCLHALLEALQKRLHFPQELLALRHVIELQNEVVVVGYSHQGHRRPTAAGVLTDFHDQVVDLGDRHGPQLVAFAVQEVEGVVRSELDFHGSARVLMQPFFDVNFVGFLGPAVAVLLADHLHFPAPFVHQLDDAVTGQHCQQRNGTENDAGVDIGDLAALEVIVSGQEQTVLQMTAVQLGRLWTRISVLPGKHGFLDLAFVDGSDLLDDVR